MATANRYLADVYMPAFNEEFAKPPREPESCLYPCPDPAGLDDILCEQHERVVGKDNCVQFGGMALQIPADRHRHHYMKMRVRVLRHIDGSLSIHHGPRKLARYDVHGERTGGRIEVVA